MSATSLASLYDDVWLIDGVRTPFAGYNGVLGLVSPIDLGIKAAKEVFKRSGVDAKDVGTVIAGSMAQASYDAYMLPRHIGLYSGVPLQVPAMLVQRVCGTGIEALIQASDAIKLGKVNLALCVGAESMSRNPVAAYTHRGGFALGQVEFKDFLYEALLDPAASCTMGQTAENVAKKFNISRADADQFAADSFARALTAQKNGFLAGEIAPVTNEEFTLEGYNSRGIKLPKKIDSFDADNHARPTSLEVLTKLRPVFGGVQTAGSSSGVVDGAAAGLVAAGKYAREKGKKPLARIVAGVSVGVPPEIMGIGPVPAIQELLRLTGLKIGDIDRVEINEAFAAQCLACERELGLDHAKLNVNGGSIALGHPLAATGVRITVSVARELQRSGKRYGISSACIGGGQGIAMLVENPDAK